MGKEPTLNRSHNRACFFSVYNKTSFLQFFTVASRSYIHCSDTPGISPSLSSGSPAIALPPAILPTSKWPLTNSLITVASRSQVSSSPKRYCYFGHCFFNQIVSKFCYPFSIFTAHFLDASWPNHYWDFLHLWKLNYPTLKILSFIQFSVHYSYFIRP